MNLSRISNINRFFQALRQIYAKAATKAQSVRMIQDPSRAFSMSLITHIEEKDRTVLVHVNFAGLYGAMGALPDYFTDLVIAKRDSSDSLKDFLDSYGHRLLESAFLIWRHHQIFLEQLLKTSNKLNRDFDHFVRGLGGFPPDEKEPFYLRCLKRYHLGLLQHKPKTALSLKLLLSSFFSEQTFSVLEHRERFLRIPEAQRSRLHSHSPPRLGAKGNLVLGQSIRDINGKIAIKIHQLDYRTYRRFLPQGQQAAGDLHPLLVQLVALFTENQWECDLLLELKAQEIPRCRLGGEQALGATGWLLSGSATTSHVARFGSQT